MSYNPYNDGDMSGTGAKLLSQQSGLSNAGYASLGISTLSGIATDIANTSAYKSKLDAMVNAKIANMKIATTNYELEQYMMAEQINDINEVLGDKLSERGLQAIKMAATLRAGAAETGTTGGTTEIATKQAFMDEHFDRANIIATERSKQKAIMNSMSLGSQRLSAELSGLSSGMPTGGTNSLLAGLTGGLGVATRGISGMSASDKAKIFNMNTKDS